jgi:cytochrome c oxidase cbb3-type subunit 3
MPTWEGRFSPAVIKALGVYIHANAAGDSGAATAAQPAAPTPAPTPVASSVPAP